MNVMAVAITDGPEELLIPAKRAEDLRREFVFGFDVIGERICVSHTRYFKACFIELGPHLQMMPGEAGSCPRTNSRYSSISRPGGSVGSASRRKYEPSLAEKPKFHASLGRKPMRPLKVGFSNPFSVIYQDSGREESEAFFISMA